MVSGSKHLDGHGVSVLDALDEFAERDVVDALLPGGLVLGRHDLVRNSVCGDHVLSVHCGQDTGRSIDVHLAAQSREGVAETQNGRQHEQRHDTRSHNRSTEERIGMSQSYVVGHVLMKIRDDALDLILAEGNLLAGLKILEPSCCAEGIRERILFIEMTRVVDEKLFAVMSLLILEVNHKRR
jgi:hypothetical protein